MPVARLPESEQMKKRSEREPPQASLTQVNTPHGHLVALLGVIILRGGRFVRRLEEERGVGSIDISARLRLRRSCSIRQKEGFLGSGWLATVKSREIVTVNPACMKSSDCGIVLPKAE